MSETKLCKKWGNKIRLEQQHVTRRTILNPKWKTFANTQQHTHTHSHMWACWIQCACDFWFVFIVNVFSLKTMWAICVSDLEIVFCVFWSVSFKWIMNWKVNNYVDHIEGWCWKLKIIHTFLTIIYPMWESILNDD